MPSSICNDLIREKRETAKLIAKKLSISQLYTNYSPKKNSSLYLCFCVGFQTIKSREAYDFVALEKKK